jgi:hypothetical protein
MAIITEEGVDALLRPRRLQYQAEGQSRRDAFDLMQAGRRAKGQDTLQPEREFSAVETARTVQQQRDLLKRAGAERTRYAAEGINTKPMIGAKDVSILPDSMTAHMAHPAASQLVQFSREQGAAQGTPFSYLDEMAAARASRTRPPRSAVEQYNTKLEAARTQRLDDLEEQNRPPEDPLSDFGPAHSIRENRFVMQLPSELRKEFAKHPPERRARMMQEPIADVIDFLKPKAPTFDQVAPANDKTPGNTLKAAYGFDFPAEGTGSQGQNSTAEVM